jgi:hypothetical protein
MSTRRNGFSTPALVTSTSTLPAGVGRTSEQVGNLLLVRDVGLKRRRGPSQRADLIDERLCRLRITDVVDGDGRAVGGQTLRRRAADPTGTTRHQRATARESASADHIHCLKTRTVDLTLVSNLAEIKHHSLIAATGSSAR